MKPENSTRKGKRAYRRYDKHFKDEAVKQLERGVSPSELAVSLGVSQSLLSSWKQQSRQPAEVVAQAAELKRLTRELKAREQEIDILKKALRIFTQTD